MSDTSIAFVRKEDAPRLPPPAGQAGVTGWIWRNVLASMMQFHSTGAIIQSVLMMIMTIVVTYVGLSTIWSLIDFSLIQAIWSDPEDQKRLACATVLQGGALRETWSGACWPFVSVKWKLITYGPYPAEELWRPNVVFLLLTAGIAWLTRASIPWRRPVGLALLGCAVALGLFYQVVFEQAFYSRVGVWLIAAVGAIFAFAPERGGERQVGLFMLLGFPLLSLLLLTGGDVEIGAGVWIAALVAIIVCVAVGEAARRSMLGAFGDAFGGLFAMAGKVIGAAAVAAFLNSSTLVDAIDAASGNVVSGEQSQALAWWAEHQTPLSPEQRESLENRFSLGLTDDQLDALSDNRREWTIGLGVKGASRAETLELQRAFLAEVEREVGVAMRPRQLETILGELRRAELRGPSEAQLSEMTGDIGLSLSAADIEALERVDWSARAFGASTVPGDREAWFLPSVRTSDWGGLLVTLVVAAVGIVASLPLGIALALGRRSSLPVIRLISITFIEFWRGVPLVTVLFMSSVMLPLFLPQGVEFDKLLRALIGVALFSSAYMAEVVRGGLQAIPKGQYEAAMAMGLPFWRMMNLIILPQALTLVIPGIVNTFIGLFKDTTLVLIIGLFDLLGGTRQTFTDASWATPVQHVTGYVLVAFIFFLFCFGMSRYSLFMERQLRKGHSR